MKKTNKEIFYPGFANYIKESHKNKLNSLERRLLDKISKEWYVTRIDLKQLSRTSIYKYIFLRPCEQYVELFNLEKEVVLIFNDYNTFSPRSLDAFDIIYKESEKLRLEKACSILVSRDQNIENKLREIIELDPELQVIIPLNYKEVLDTRFPNIMVNRFKKHFFERDFFNYKSELKKELYFFGRNQLVYKMIDFHNSGENTGLFGLRKTGKTSVAYAIKRVMEKIDKKAIFISCQDTSFHKRRWNEALHYIIQEIVSQIGFKKFPKREEIEYTEKDASLLFEQDLIKINKKLGGKSILLIFDEIENISFELSPSGHWAKGNDFIYLWQSIRSKFQKHSTIFTYLIIGTNPKFIEQQYINEKENPIFKQLSIHYLTGFDVSQTKKMFSKLGGLSGLYFEDLVISKINETYGGHPMLMRLVGSIIHNSVSKNNRPKDILKGQYEKYKIKFDRENFDYIRMIIEVLEKFYPYEYEMLEYLALGDKEAFIKLSNDHPELILHLLGYGIIFDEGDNIFSFKIELVKEYITKNKKYQIKLNNDDERRNEIRIRTEVIEVFFRKHIRIQLKTFFGKTEAKKIVLEIYGYKRKTKYGGNSYKELFNSDIVDIYLSDLIKILRKYWDPFKNNFGPNKEKFISNMEIIKEYRNSASHSSKIGEEGIIIFRKYAKEIESRIKDIEE